jgi:hypothetical protein
MKKKWSYICCLNSCELHARFLLADCYSEDMGCVTPEHVPHHVMADIIVLEQGKLKTRGSITSRMFIDEHSELSGLGGCNCRDIDVRLRREFGQEHRRGGERETSHQPLGYAWNDSSVWCLHRLSSLPDCPLCSSGHPEVLACPPSPRGSMLGVFSSP